MTTFNINSNDEGQKLFAFIKKVFKETNLSIIYKWFRLGKIKVNNKRTKARDYILKANDVVVVYDSFATSNKRMWAKVNYDDLSVVYEDDNILIADKPFNVEVHSEFNECLDNMVRSYLSDKGEFKDDENSFIVSHVHRLDKLTSGLVIYAKNKISLDYLLANIGDKEKITKSYIARVDTPLIKTGVITGYIDYNAEIQKAVFKNKKFYRAKESTLIIKDVNDDYVNIELVTGKKHQIRATLEFLGSPIVNDFRYGSAVRTNERYICLNANEISFSNMEEPFSYLNEKVISSKKMSF